MSIHNIFLYVAVVSDTDGSAFITKAEFDSLKNNFQAQIDAYNSSIDNTIDRAIAGYLAGISLSKETTPNSILNSVNAASSNSRKLMARSWDLPAEQDPYGGVLCFYVQWTNAPAVGSAYTSGENRKTTSTWIRMGPDNARRNQLLNVNYPLDGSYKWGKYMMVRDTPYGKYLTGDYYTFRYYLLITGAVAGTGTGLNCWVSDGNGVPEFSYPGDLTFTNNYWGIETNKAAWTAYINESDGTHPSAGVTCNVQIGASYQVYDRNTFEIPIIGQNTGAIKNFVNVNDLGYMQSQNTPMEIKPYVCFSYATFPEYKQFDGKTTVTIGPSRTHTADDGDWGTGYEFKLPWQRHKTTTMAYSDLIDYETSNIFGATVKRTDGIPLCKCDISGKLTAKLKFHNITNSDNVICAFKKDRFPNNATYVSDSSLGVTQTSFAVDTEVTVDMKVTKGDTIWLKARVDGGDANNYSKAWVESTSLKIVEE